MKIKSSPSFVTLLWWMYGFTYDGLKVFWPYQHIIDLTLKELQPVNGETLLDLGCGTGNLLAGISSLAPHTALTGVDMSASMLQIARKKTKKHSGGVHIIQSDVLIWLAKQEEASYDAIVSVNLVYVFSASQRQELWAQLHRVLKPGGRMVINTSTMTGSGDIINEHLQNSPWWYLLHPKLIGVFVIDSLINALGNRGSFGFAPESTLASELELNGFRIQATRRCYGGDSKGVNTLFTLYRLSANVG